MHCMSRLPCPCLPPPTHTTTAQIQVVANTAFNKYEFYVLPDAWAVHLPHRYTPAALSLWGPKTKNEATGSMIACNDRNFFVSLPLMEKGVYRAVLDERLLAALARVAWLQGPRPTSIPTRGP